MDLLGLARVDALMGELATFGLEESGIRRVVDMVERVMGSGDRDTAAI